MDHPLLDRIRAGVIGDGSVMATPYGSRRVTYADYTASGRALDFIEDSIRACRPSSTTAISCANTSHPGSDPWVFIGPFEHHCNELPWRESIAEVVVIPEDCDGHVDVDVLAEQLRRYTERPLKICGFSAASNVTGIVTDTARITTLLHEHGALSFWDFAAAAPYVEIDLGGAADPARLDAVFLSPHKFIGGPGTPGMLAVRRELLRNRADRARRRHGGLRQPPASIATSMIRSRVKRAVRRPSSSRSGPGWCSRSSRRSAYRRSAPRRSGCCGGQSIHGARTRGWRSSATSPRGGC